jgi:hypothetical protein
LQQCPHCRNALADYVPVCPFCGVHLPVAPAGSPQMQRYAGPQENSGKATAYGLRNSLLLLARRFGGDHTRSSCLVGDQAQRRRACRPRQGDRGPGSWLRRVGIIPVLIVAAIAIPNLLRSRMAVNEASAVGTLRTYNTAMVQYVAECANIRLSQIA